MQRRPWIKNPWGSTWPAVRVDQRHQDLRPRRLVRILQLGFAVEVVDRSGNVSKTYEPGRVEGLPALDVAGSNLNRVKLRVVSLRS